MLQLSRSPDKQRMPSEARSRYRDASAFTSVATALLASCGLSDIGIFCLDAMHIALTAKNPLIAKLYLLLHIATAIAFLAWFDRTYANIEAVAGTTEFGRSWAIGGFFAPPFFAFRPCQIATEMWRSSETESTGSTPLIIYVWWGLFVSSGVLFFTPIVDAFFFASAASAAAAIAVIQVLTKRVAAARVAQAAQTLSTGATEQAIRPGQQIQRPPSALLPQAIARTTTARKTTSGAQPLQPSPAPTVRRPTVGHVATATRPRVIITTAPYLFLSVIFLGVAAMLLIRAAMTPFDTTSDLRRRVVVIEIIGGCILLTVSFVINRFRNHERTDESWLMVVVGAAVVGAANVLAFIAIQ